MSSEIVKSDLQGLIAHRHALYRHIAERCELLLAVVFTPADARKVDGYHFRMPIQIHFLRQERRA